MINYEKIIEKGWDNLKKNTNLAHYNQVTEEAILFIIKEVQKELLEEILDEVNLTKGNWSDIIENKLVSLDTIKTSKENK